ncbi:hypothetical protein MOE45_13560 [Bacillus atrophaeus]|nr:hypothetical protein [Bacillus atrophaeus]
MSKLTITPTSLTGKSNKNKGRFAIAVALASISVTGSGHVITGNETTDSNSAHIKRYSFAYDNTKSNLTEASPKKEEQFVVDKKQFVFKQKDVSKEKIAQVSSSFRKPMRFSENNEAYREIKVSDLTEVEHSVYSNSADNKRKFSFRKPMELKKNNTDYYEVSQYEPIGYTHELEEDGWI